QRAAPVFVLAPASRTFPSPVRRDESRRGTLKDAPRRETCRRLWTPLHSHPLRRGEGMNRRQSRRSHIAIHVGFLLVVSLRANWPQWRGPNSNGSTSTAHDLPVNWTQTENVVWRTKMPSWAAATPIVWQDTIFVTSAEEGSLPLGRGRRASVSSEPAPDKIFLLAINRKDGSIRWRKQIGSGNQIFRKQNSASPSAITDGKQVWIMTGNGEFTCLTKDGVQVWKRDIQAD